MLTTIARATMMLVLFMGVATQLLSGQVSAAALAGTVRDSSGNPIAGAEVRARDQATGHVYLARSGSRGNYWITALPPSRYEVGARAIGYAPIRLQPLVLAVGRTVTVDLVLPAAPQQLEELEVVEGAARLETTRSDVSFVIDHERIENLPVESRNLIDLAQYAPGTTTPTGQLEGTPPVHIGGLNSYSVGVLVDGGMIVGGVIHDLAANFPLLAIQEFEVLTSGYSAEYGQAASGVLNAVTRRGTNQWEAEGFGLYRDRRLNALGAFESEKPAYDRTHWGLAVGGPLARDRTHLFAAVERKTENTFGVVETGGLFPSLEGAFPTPLERTLLFARLDHRFSAAHEVTLRYGAEASDKQGERGFAPTCAAIGFTSATIGSASMGVDDEERSHSLLLRDRWSLSSEALNEFSINFVQHTSRRTRLDDGPMLARPSYCDGGNLLAWDNSSYRLDFRESLSREWVSRTGVHRVKIGASIGIVRATPRVDNVGNGVFFGFPSDTSLPGFFTQPTNNPIGTDETNVQLGFFVQDDWSLSDRFTLNLGLRYDTETNGTNQDHLPSELIRSLPFVSATPRPIDTDNIAPRLGFAWDPSGRGRTVIRGAFGLYYDQLAVWYASLERPVMGRTALNPGTTKIDAIPDSAFVPTPPGGRLIGIMDSVMRTPFTRQLSLGVEHIFEDGLRLRVDGMWVEGRNLLFTQIRSPQFPPRYPEFTQITQIRALGLARAKLLTIVAARTFPWGRLEAGYTLADRRTTSESWLGAIPVPDTATDFSGELGPSNWDERHRLVVLAEVQVAQRLGLGLRSVYASARPWTVLVAEDKNLDGARNDRPDGVGRNSRRGPDYFRADLGLWWRVPLGPGENDIVVNVYNLLNRTNLDPGSIQQLWGSPLYGQAIAGLPRRQVEIGLRSRF